MVEFETPEGTAASLDTEDTAASKELVEDTVASQEPVEESAASQETEDTVCQKTAAEDPVNNDLRALEYVRSFILIYLRYIRRAVLNLRSICIVC